MTIEVRLFATLREGRWKKSQLQYEIGTTPRDIIRDLNIDEKDIAILLINGRDGGFDIELNDGDVLSIFPPVGGG